MKKRLSVLGVILLLVVCTTILACCTTQNINIESGNFAFEKIAAKAVQSSVRVTCGNGGGSGVIVSKDGYVITNDHVVAGSTEAIIHLVDAANPDKYFEYKAEVVAEIKDDTDYAKMDLALLKIKDVRKFTPVEFNVEDVKFGDYGVMVGNPKQIGILCEKAMVANPKVLLNHQDLKMNYIALDAPVNSGNSGGGFFDANGKLAGIVTLRQYDSSNSNSNVVFGIGYAIPALKVKGYLARYKISV